MKEDPKCNLIICGTLTSQQLQFLYWIQFYFYCVRISFANRMFRSFIAYGWSRWCCRWWWMTFVYRWMCWSYWMMWYFFFGNNSCVGNQNELTQMKIFVCKIKEFWSYYLPFIFFGIKARWWWCIGCICNMTWNVNGAS